MLKGCGVGGNLYVLLNYSVIFVPYQDPDLHSTKIVQLVLCSSCPAEGWVWIQVSSNFVSTCIHLDTKLYLLHVL